MPIQTTQSGVQTHILSQYKLTGRIHKDIDIILGKSGRIDSEQKAKAILEYNKQAVVLFTDNKDLLPLKCMDAQNYLKHGNSNLLDYFIKAGKYIKKNRNIALARLSNFLNENGKVFTQNK